MEPLTAVSAVGVDAGCGAVPPRSGSGGATDALERRINLRVEAAAMLTTVEAVIEPDGRVRLLEPVQVSTVGHS